MRILVAGEQGSGKTSLVSVFSDGEHNRGRIGGVAEPSTSMFGDITIMDSSSNDPEDIGVFTTKLLVADVVLLVFDVLAVSERNQDVGEGEVMKAILQVKFSKPVILVGNKLDLMLTTGHSESGFLDKGGLRHKLTDLLAKYDFLQGVFFTSTSRFSSLDGNPICTPPQTILKYAMLHARVPVSSFYNRKDNTLTVQCLRAVAAIHCSLDKDFDGFISGRELLEVQDALFFDRKCDVFKEIGLTFAPRGVDLQAFVAIFTTLLQKYYFPPVLSLLSHFQWDYQDHLEELRMRPSHFNTVVNAHSKLELSPETLVKLERSYRSWSSLMNADTSTDQETRHLSRENVAGLTGVESWSDSYPNIIQQYSLECGEPRTVVLALSAKGHKEEVPLTAWIEYWHLLAAAVPASTLSSLLKSAGCMTSRPFVSRASPFFSAGLVDCSAEGKTLQTVMPTSGGEALRPSVFKYVHQKGGSYDAEEKGEHMATTLLTMLSGHDEEEHHQLEPSCKVAMLLCEGAFNPSIEGVICGASPLIPDIIPRVVLLSTSGSRHSVREQEQEEWRRGLERLRLPPPIVLPSGSMTDRGNIAFDKLLQNAHEAVARHPHGGISHSQGRRLFLRAITSRIGTFWRALLHPFSMLARTLFHPLITMLPSEHTNHTS